MSIRTIITPQYRKFQYNGYSVLVKEEYMSPWTDGVGKPTQFWVFYIDSNKDNVLSTFMYSKSWQMDLEILARYREAGVPLEITQIENDGFFGKYIDWAVNKAKELL